MPKLRFIIIIFGMMIYVLLKGGTHIISSENNITSNRPLISSDKRVDFFTFHKAITINFDFSSEVIYQAFEGQLRLDWTSPLIANVSLFMEGHDENVFIRAHFIDDFTLGCIEAPKNLNEKESELVLLLKNLILDYAFKTNRDDNGDYLASLNTKDIARGIRQATKIKSKYLDQSKSNLKVQQSLHEITYGKSLLKAKGEEHFKLLLPAQNQAASTKNTYHLSAISEWRNLIPDMNRELAICSKDFTQQLYLNSTLTRQDLKELLFNIASLDRGSRHKSIRKINRALRSSPEFLEDFMEWVLTVQTDRQLSSLAVGILGTVGTPEAQKELVNLFNTASEETLHLQYQVLNTFTLTSSRLTDESRGFLKSQITNGNAEFVEGAAYALGSSIQTTGEMSDFRYLLNQLEGAETSKEKGIYLDALINSDNPEAREALEKYALTKDKFIQKKAFLGLSLLEHESINK